jgi:hypothetical protein
MNLNFYFQRIEYLAASFHDDGITGREVIVLTICSEDWRPHSSGITRPEVERLQLGRQRLLAAAALTLIFFLNGCSTRVEVSTERPAPGDPPATENFSTTVAVELLPPAPTEAKQPEVEVAGIANFAIFVEGDLHLHQHDHLHLENPTVEDRPASKRNQEKSETEARSAGIDPRCERLLGEHVERVEGWKAMMGE